MSLRKAINEHCKSCIYDDVAPGTWKQQITLCSVTCCSLFDVRPVSRGQIPESVLSFYGVTLDDFQAISKKLSTGSQKQRLPSQVGKSATSQDFRA